MEEMRVLVGTITAEFEDVESLGDDERARVLHPQTYARSQPYAAALRAEGSQGIVYPSVRQGGGPCVAPFKPTAAGLPSQERHLKYHFDGARVRRYFDYRQDTWIDR